MGPLGSLTCIRTKSKHFVLESWPEAEATQMEQGPLLPRKVLFHPHPALSQFSPPPAESSQPAQAVSRPPPLASHSFVQTFTGTYCVSVTVPGPGDYRDAHLFSPSDTGPVGERVEVLLRSSHCPHPPHHVISSENHGFSISSF